MRWIKGWLLLGVLAFACGDDRDYADGPEGGAGTGGDDGPVSGSSGGGGKPQSGGNTGNAGKAGSGGASSGAGGEAGSEEVGGAGGVPTEEDLLANGQPCSADTACDSGFCRDEVCCATECEGSCMACAEAATGKPSGTCELVQPGLDPRDECEATAPTGCGDDGGCNGEGACRKFGQNQVCGEAACNGSEFSGARTCDGEGACSAAMKTECGEYPCKTTGCAAPCQKDTECGDGNYCATGLCRTKKTDGEACAAAKECRSDSCVDGVCCESSCTGGCKACSKAKTGQASGLCLAIPSEQDPDNECAVDTQNTCGRDGTCNGSGACRVQPSGKSCGSASCSGTTLTPAGSCDGSSNCDPSSARACPGSTVCASATACVTTCTGDQHCAAGNYCNAGQCLPKKGTGVACTRLGECTSGSCVDGVCCGSTCSLSCQGCSNAATGLSNGTCGARTSSATSPCPSQNPTTCVSLSTDANNCNECGAVCSGSNIPSTVPACSAGKCGTNCSNSKYQICNGVTTACALATFNFDTGSGSWHNNAENSVFASTKVTRNGSAGALEATGSADLNYPAVAMTSLCTTGEGAQGTLALQGKKVSAWIYLGASYTDVTPSFKARCRAVGVRSDFSKTSFAWVTSPTIKQWFEVTGTFGANDHSIIEVGVECEVPADWFANDAKRWFLDDFAIQN